MLRPKTCGKESQTKPDSAAKYVAGFDAAELGLAMGLIRGLRLRIEGVLDGYDYLHFAAYFFAFPYLVPRSIFLPLCF